MYSEIVNITPEMAREMLALNIENNRRINKERVAMYANAMRDGEWTLTHQGIAFNEDGKLVDGQHRLQAVVNSGATVKMMVTRDVPMNQGELFNIDMGQGRTFTAQLRLAGINQGIYDDVSAIALSYLRNKCGVRRTTFNFLMAYIDKHINIFAVVRKYSKRSNGKSINSQILAAMTSALYNGVQESVLDALREIYINNDVSKANDLGLNPRPILDMRDYYHSHRGANNPTVFAYYESAIRSFADGNKIVRQKKDTFAELMR